MDLTKSPDTVQTPNIPHRNMQNSESTVPNLEPLAENTPPADRTSARRILPDVATEASPEIGGKIDRVGMANIEVMARIQTCDNQVLTLPAFADAQVDLVDESKKGIHMSRLFLQLQKSLDRESISPGMLKELLTELLKSHDSISRSAHVAIEFRLPMQQMALKSELSGWRHYPVRIEASFADGQVDLRLGVRVTYSSTCPCSASLSRQLLAEKFESDFDSHRWLSISSVLSWLGENGSLATPHSQRSHVDATVRLTADQSQLPIELIISEIETSLNTPVQAAVKRPDEQQFAKLNGSNLMFCEDAARRLQFAMDDLSLVSGFHLEINHLESLHPHDAVARVSKGIDRGVRFRDG